MTLDEQVPERHRRVVRALRSGGPAAPESLRRRIEEMQAQAAARPVGWRVRPRLRVPRLAVAGGVAVVAAIALLAALTLGGPAGPSVVQAAELSLLSAEQPAPTRDPTRPQLLTRSFAGVTYPNWSGEFNWRAVGERSDELDGRETETVFYRHTHHRIGYTVISGEAIKPPEDAETLNVGGLELHRFRLGRQDVVTFERNRRTCVLSGDVHDPDTLVKLAKWKGEGAVDFQ